MHMADALISPAVGGTMWAAAAGVTFYSAHKMRCALDERRVPLMGVLGAFVFAAQMINFTIPGTGSSGHLGGGLLLAILLGSPAAFIKEGRAEAPAQQPVFRAARAPGTNHNRLGKSRRQIGPWWNLRGLAYAAWG